MFTLANAQTADLTSMLTWDSPMFVLIIVGMASVVAIIGIIAGSAASTSRTREREQTKRELAAYVAEGSMSGDQAVAILASNRSACDVTIAQHGGARACPA